ncbi:MAG: hypothetical protein AAGB34_09290, partial [Planctomycetota bacterium]
KFEQATVIASRCFYKDYVDDSVESLIETANPFFRKPLNYKCEHEARLVVFLPTSSGDLAESYQIPTEESSLLHLGELKDIAKIINLKRHRRSSNLLISRSFYHQDPPTVPFSSKLQRVDVGPVTIV